MEQRHPQTKFLAISLPESLAGVGSAAVSRAWDC
jgi:hypothetical protein